MKRQIETKNCAKKPKLEMNLETVELAMDDGEYHHVVFGSETSPIKLNNILCPDEIVSQILDFANVATLQQTKLVCRNFYEHSVMDKHYEKSMTEEFPLYTRRLKHLGEFKGLMMKLMKRRFICKDEARIERLFWWMVGKSDQSPEAIEKIIVENGLVDLMTKIEEQFYKVLHKLIGIGSQNDMDDFEDDGGMYSVCGIISEGEEYYNKICADPELGADHDGHEAYMYPFNKTTYIPEDYSGSELEEVYEALSSGYEAFKELDL